MNVTNKHNIHPVFVQYVLKKLHPPKKDSMGVTTLINPPIIRELTLKHWDTLEVDISEQLWALFGTGLHVELAKFQTTGVIKDLKLKYKVGNIIVVGIMDMYTLLTKTIDDHKITSVWSVIYASHPEWDRQLNLYNLLATKYNLPCADKINIHAFMRDWQQSKATQDESYPQVQLRTFNIPVWPLEQTEQYLLERVKIHQQPGIPCTPEERWTTETKYAVKKKGTKKAMRGGVHNSKESAEAFIAKQKPEVKTTCITEERPGEDKKCKGYCMVRDVCPFNKYNKKG